MSPLLWVLIIAVVVMLVVLRPIGPPDDESNGTRELHPVGDPAMLNGVAGPAKGKSWQVRPLGGVGFVLGRGGDCNVVVGGRIASRQHATITLDNGHWQIHDMASSNGTFVNRQRVSSASLTDGDVITIGDSALVFQVKPSAGAVAERMDYPIEPLETPAAPPPSGFVVPGYERYRLRQVAKGSAAVILKADPPAGGASVAIKVLTHADPFFREKFDQEAFLLGYLKHEHIVTALDSGLAPGGYPYIVMEYCSYGSLHQRLNGQPLPEALVRTVGIQTCAALDHAHRYRVVHRDIKPANLLFAGPKHVKVADFGISRWAQSRSITVHGTVLGTVNYMSPEQARGDVVSYQADIYSLGVVLYQMLTGQPPFTGEPTDVMAQHVKNPPPPFSGVAPDLARAVMRALEKAPGRRYPSARHFAQALGGGGQAERQAPGPSRHGLRLVRMAPAGLGDVILSGQNVELGRKVLDPSDQQISRTHARLMIHDGVCWVDDLGSSNGTWVNHHRVVERVALRPGDMLRIGNSVLRLEGRG